MIHELRTYNVLPGRAAEYLELAGSVSRPIRGDPPRSATAWRHSTSSAGAGRRGTVPVLAPVGAPGSPARRRTLVAGTPRRRRRRWPAAPRSAAGAPARRCARTARTRTHDPAGRPAPRRRPQAHPQNSHAASCCMEFAPQTAIAKIERYLDDKFLRVDKLIDLNSGGMMIIRMLAGSEIANSSREC